jgi:hypothetical protein
MRFDSGFLVQIGRAVVGLVSCLLVLAGCASRGVENDIRFRPRAPEMRPLTLSSPVELKLSSEMGRVEKIAYLHRSKSASFEGAEVRSRREDSLEFTSQAETLKIDPPAGDGVTRFTQAITVVHKDGTAALRDFAMPELGERLEVVTDSSGRIIKSGDWPQNSIFYVPTVSLPNGPVSIGDTWTMQASWLSLDEMVPYQLDLVSILKGFWECGSDRCAEIELSGEVSMQGPINQLMTFRGQWRGRMFFAMNAGTVVWSRVDSEERLVTDRLRRDEIGCLEASMVEPAALKFQDVTRPSCEAMISP